MILFKDTIKDRISLMSLKDMELKNGNSRKAQVKVWRMWTVP
jgi:hypothetical protein